MKAVVLISEKNPKEIQWKYDQVMALIAYDFDISVVFIGSGCAQLQNNKAWKCLSMYGVENVYVISQNNNYVNNTLFKVTDISNFLLQKLIKNSEIIL